MHLSNLKITAYKMAVDHKYTTPWCGWATWKDEAGVIQGMNCEGRTQEEALRKIKAMVDNERRT